MARKREIPHFDSVEEESDFWDSVDTTDFIDPDEPPVEFTIGGELAKAVAARRGTG